MAVVGSPLFHPMVVMGSLLMAVLWESQLCEPLNDEVIFWLVERVLLWQVFECEELHRQTQPATQHLSLSLSQ